MYKNKEKRNKEKEERNKEEEEGNKSIQTTIRLYSKDIKNFRKYSESTGLTQKECFRQMLNVWSAVRQDEENAEMKSFETYVENNFNPDRSMSKRLFSITGNYLGGFYDQIIIQNIEMTNKYNLYTFNQAFQKFEEIEYERSKIVDWCNNGINKEFGIHLDIDKEVSSGSVKAPIFYYNYSLNMYWDLKRKKYLVEDIFEIAREKNENNPVTSMPKRIKRHVFAQRYFYVSSVKELKEKFDKKIYLLMRDDKKRIMYNCIEKKVILPMQLENELEKYYIE